MFLIKKHFSATFALSITVIVAQLVRASDCGSEGRRFEPGQSPDPGNHFPGFFFLSAFSSAHQ
jgi:hypothetical protein